MQSVTNEDWIEKFNKYLKRKYPDRSTATHYISDMKIFTKFYKENLLDVTSQEIDTFIDDQRKQEYAPATIKRRAASLKVFYDFLDSELKDPQRTNPVNVRNQGGRIPQRLPRNLSNDVSPFIDAEMERNIKPKTINSVLDIFYSVLRRLHHCGQLDEVPPRPAIVLSDPLPKYLLPDELLKLEERVRQMTMEDQSLLLDIALYYALAHTGLRIGEPLDLKVQDLDLNTRRLLVQEGKGRKDRVVYFTETAARTLAAYMQTVPHAPGDLIFSLNQKPLSYHQASNRLHRIGRLADIQSLYPLRLPYTYATTLLNNGMTIDILRQLMGHIYINTTLIYARLAQATVEQQYLKAIQQIGLDSHLDNT